MKRWEEARRQKLYADKINKAKPTLSTQPKKSTAKATSSNASSSTGFNQTKSSIQTKITKTGGIALAVSEDILSEHDGDLKISDLPIFQLLKAFKLQQYTLKLAEKGYGEELYKLALLNDSQREALVTQLKVLPGHRAKLVSLFSVIDEIYPKKKVAEQLKQFTPGRQSDAAPSDKKPKRVQSAFRNKQGAHQHTSKQLLHQYEALDPITKQAFNETFLANLESVKYSMGQLMSQHVNKEESKKAINSIFPPQFFGYGKQVLDQLKGDEGYNQEIEQLLRKYTATGSYQNYGNEQALQKKAGFGQAPSLKTGISQALKDIDKINLEIQEKQMQASNQQQQEVQPKRQDQRPDSKQNTASQYEVFSEDQDRSRISHTLQDESSLLSQSQIDDAISVLDDPLALSMSVKDQYQEAVNQAQKTIKGGDTSMMNPLAQGDDSKLNVTTQYYQKQNVYKDQNQDLPKRPLSPLIDKDERNKVWNLGQSLDSKKVTSALGYLDLKQICYCLAHASMKHIEFSRGHYFLEELQRSQEQSQPSGKQLEFTYNLQDNLKIDIEKAKQRKQVKEEQSREEFQQLKKKLEQNQKVEVLDQTTSDTKKMGPNLGKGGPSAIEDQREDDIADEIEESDDLIEDFYQDESPKSQMSEENKSQKAKTQGDEIDEDIDFNYSQTHLDDFLKSQAQIRGSGVQSSQLLNTFLTSYNKMRSGTAKSFAESQGAGVVRRDSQMNPIQENLELSESEKSDIRAKSRAQEVEDGDEEEDLGRSEEDIDLNSVEVNSKSSPVKAKSKPILTSDEVAKARHQEESKESFQLDVTTKQGFQELLRFQMRIFDQNYDFERDELLGGESMYLGDPSLEELYYYCKYVIISGRMEKEIPILCLVYIERFLTKTGLLMNHANWKRITLISLLLASKIWDDDSLENVHFPQVMPDVTLKEISSLEKVFLQLLDFDLVIRGGEYAKYYFILKTFAETFNSTLPLGPLPVEKMSELQNNTLKTENSLRDKYDVKLSLQKSM